MTHAPPPVSLLAKTYDYVVVGAGSAGCVVARRLVDGSDGTILLLEAGGSDKGVKSISNPPQWIEKPWLPVRLGLRLRAEPARRPSLHSLAPGQGARGIG